MTDTTEIACTVAADAPERLRAIDGNGHTPDSPPPPRCPFPRSFSYVTEQYSIELDYAAFDTLSAAVYDVWEATEQGKDQNVIGDMFEALLERIDAMQAWTGWGGIPGKYLGETGPGAP